MRRLLASLLILAAGLAARPAAAAGFDEFQIFDGRIGEPGAVDFNLHYNLGRRGRLDSPREAGAPRNGMLLTPEIGFPTAPWHEIAVFLPVAREFTGDIYGGGFKVRNTFVSPGAADRPFAYGLDVELRHQSARFSEADWAVTLRPIIDLRTGRWQLILNPAVEMPLGRGGADLRPGGARRAAGVRHRLARPRALHGFRPLRPARGAARPGAPALRHHRRQARPTASPCMSASATG